MAKKMDKVDVVIVGTGWSGSIPAAELSKEGYNVVALERGQDQDQNDFVGAKDELRYTSRFWMQEENSLNTITARSTTDEVAFPLRTIAENNEGTDLGGNSSHWSGVTHRATAFDFEAYTKTVENYGKDKIPDEMFLQDWGITYDEMEEYYDKFEKMAGTSGEEDPVGVWRSSDYPTPPMKDTIQIRLFKHAAKNLGYHPFQIPSANLSEQYENPDGQTINACQYCSFCLMYGCDFGAKSDPLITVIPTAEETGNYEKRVKSYARRVVKDDDGKAKGVMYTDMRTGKDYIQPADVVVLGGYALSNTKLMLLSEIGEPYDPETKTGVIGKNAGGFHSPHAEVTGFFENAKFNLSMGAGALGGTFSDLDSDNLDTTDLDFIGGGMVEVRQKGNAPIGNPFSPANIVPKGTPSWGKEFKEKSLHYNNRHSTVIFKSAAYGFSFNYMDLDPNYTDVFGDPLLRVTSTIPEHDKNITKFGLEKMSELMEEMGADIIDESEVPEDWDHTQGGGEAGGGVIMGDDPEISAVNNYSQVWDMENLFVIGASALPQKIQQQTATVGAFAYRAAEGIQKYLEGDGGLLVEPKDKTQKS